MFIDTHSHMDHKRFDSGRKSVLQIAKDCGIGTIINPAIDYESNYSMRNKLDDYDWIYYGVGIHPNCVGTEDVNDADWEAGLLKLADIDNKKVVAIGETGLDFHRLTRNELGELDEEGVINIGRQYKWFREQLKLSSMTGLPLILHIRNASEERIRELKSIDDSKKLEHIDAHKEAISILKEFQENLLPDIKGVVHCFASDDYEDAIAYINMGYMLGIGGAVTFSQNEGLKKIVKKVPMESIVLETDSPFMLPEGNTDFAGKRNMPITIPYIAGIVAELKGITVEEVENITTENARKLFRL